jgi:MarR family transcriptional regulator, lower aerobic nicotinate degradation pathway regulator
MVRYNATMADSRVEAYQSLTLLDHLSRAGRRAGEAVLEPIGLRPRHLIVLRVLDYNGTASQQGLADSLSLDASNVVGVLNELEERELIKRRRDPLDRRRHMVELSDSGRESLIAADALLAGVENEVLRALSLEERATLNTLLVRAAGGQMAAESCAAAPELGACLE